MTITVERLRNILRYDPETGVFTWIIPPSNHGRMRGKAAGGLRSGYLLIKIDGRKYGAHRLAWLYSHGAWPTGRIDHINGVGLDNRLANLRDATAAQNCANSRRWRGKELPKGVRLTAQGRYQARISFEKKQIALGTFLTVDEAAAAYASAAARLYGEFARAA